MPSRRTTVRAVAANVAASVAWRVVRRVARARCSLRIVVARSVAVDRTHQLRTHKKFEFDNL